MLFRECVGRVLRALRLEQKRTLREVAQGGHVSLGYLSEIERGHKEASSEMLESIATALQIPLWRILWLVAQDMSGYELESAQTAQAA
ncbi:MAG: helix-turn-helix domain-containing protein [Propionibacteriaceae bacterium]|nr:helix-turn-helix domain-containing protein [Propionibacteriaceae bacterium]